VLTLESTPPGADVTLERYVDRAGYRVLVGAKSLGKTPIAGHSLGDGPGSYRLTFVAGGRVEVRYPVLLGRGEEVRLSVDLPAKERIPEGLVYVPPGRFLYGSTDPEPLRRGFINTVPLHELRTEGFAIGRNEVTFAEWLDFLRALPPSERKVRMPDMMTREWGVQLEEDPTGAYRVVFVVSGERKVAGEGEMLSFPARNKRAEQDWRQFPVSGVSMEDAVAYVEWLAATGMVPGARLCTEYEWERAARGADDRVYPHGDAIRAEDANYDETYGRTTGAFAPDEIGSHPTSLSPFGLEDMAGNVLETVTSTRVEGEVLTRGGAAYFDRFGALVTNRTVAEPKTRDLWGGVRVCATAE
jgi:formylglycine-generating enzyme required for sulfatase activity